MEPEHSATATSEPSDAELIAAVRTGDRDAYGVLWSRHEVAARNLARQIAKSSDVDELVSESFYRVLRALDGGGGPDGAFRPYLLSTLRRVNIDTGRGYYQRVSLTDDDADLEAAPGAAGVAAGAAASAADITIEQGEQTAAWKAWASLPDSSRTLLWHLIVEEETPAQIAPLMGTTPNGVSSRAVRAKERLRQAFLQQHVRLADAEQCEWTRLRVGEYVRNALSNREQTAVEAHLKDCKRCKAVVAEIADVNQSLKVLVAPIILGGAAVATGYLHAAGAASGVHLAGLGQLRRLVRPSVAAGAAAVVAVAGITAGLVAANQSHHKRAAEPPPPPPTSSQPALPPIVAPPPSTPPTTSPKKPSPKSPVVPPPAPTPTPTPATPRPTPAPTTPRPTPTTPTTPRPTPAPSTHKPAPTPAPAPPSSPPSTPPSSPPSKPPTSPPSSPPSKPPTSPPPPPIVTRVVAVHADLRFDFGLARLDITVPSGWRITRVRPHSLAIFRRCTIETPTHAVCAIIGNRHQGREFTVSATGPQTTPPPMLRTVITELGRVTSVREYPL